MRIQLEERVNHKVTVRLELWTGFVPEKGVRRYVWDRVWRRVYGPFTRVSATGETKLFP